MSSPDIVGIGAVNLDYIIDSGSLGSGADPNDLGSGPQEGPEPVEPIAFDGFDYGGERSATAEEIGQALERLKPLGPVPSPGGSALNTLATIAASGAPVSVGYVGVRGSAPVDGFSFPEWFSSLAIDDRFIAPADDVTGICLSYTDRGRRSMLTTDGANRLIMNHIEENADGLLSYLGGAKLVLVTSFANLTDIGSLVELLQALKDQRGGEVQICVDPGALWSIGEVPAGIDELLALADLVLLNREEFEVFTTEAADQTVVVKGADRVEIHSGSGREMGTGTGRSHRRFTNPEVLAPDDVVDDTGAGDAFAGGFLPSLVLEELEPSDGVELGFRLAREKLRWSGLAGLHRYADIYERFMVERSS